MGKRKTGRKIKEETHFERTAEQKEEAGAYEDILQRLFILFIYSFTSILI
jgi:hypothetical protein